MSVATSGVNCILLLGAGASKPAGYPVTNDFFDIIEERIDDGSVHLTLEFFTEDVGIDNLDRLFRNIHGLSSLTEDEEPSVEFLNREISSTVDEVGLTDEARSKIEEVPNTYREFLENCRELRNEFVKSFNQHFSWVDALEGGYSHLDTYIRMLQKVNEGNNPVFTTNYDPTVESLVSKGWKVNTLFNETGTWEGDSEHVSGPETINLYKLHGSTTWTRTNRGLFEIAPGFTPSIDLEQERELVPPGRGTGTKRQRDPYSTHWRLFERHLSAADKCVVIGHRLADEELAATLNRYDTDIILVNPDEDALEHAKIDDYKEHVEMRMETAHRQVAEFLDDNSDWSGETRFWSPSETSDEEQ